MLPEMTVISAFAEPVSAAGAALLRGVEVTGPEGRLEALLNEGAPDAPFAALVCHPHPKGGGTMHNKVVYHAMKVLNAPAWGFRLPVLRFNFRGTGLSEGAHHGTDEVGDVLAAMDWLRREFARPLVVAGFSFGAAMAARACCAAAVEDVRALALLGLPTHIRGERPQYDFLAGCGTPRLLLSGGSDQFAPAEELHEAARAAGNPTRLVLLPGADHFFTGRVEAMQHELALWLKEQLS